MIIIINRGIEDYHITWQAMRAYTDARDANSEDQIWLVQHPAVFTQGQAGKAEHVLNPQNIPVVQSDRGGQITYHGPGQLVAYILVDIHRAKLNIRQLVSKIETAVIGMLSEYKIKANTRKDAPGVYVDGAKICSIGLRIRRGYSYHGLALNVDMDLEPFSRINPCGYADMKMTQLKDFVPNIKMADVEVSLVKHLQEELNL